MGQKSEKNEWIYGVKAMAAFVGVSRRTLERWLADESSGFPARKHGGGWFGVSDEIRGWLRGSGGHPGPDR